VSFVNGFYKFYLFFSNLSSLSSFFSTLHNFLYMSIYINYNNNLIYD
jgi:hypothetical protein